MTNITDLVDLALRIGIDVGGTKIELAALAGRDSEVLRRRVSTPKGDYEATLAAIASLVAEAEKSAGRAASIGIGIPGAISPASGLVKNANSVWLNGHPFDKDITALLGRPVRVANDANCFALSEAVTGAAAGASVVFGVILGTGVGGGLVVGGRVLTGPNAIAGEWGHTPLPWPQAGEAPGPRCWCGRRGCIETFLSGPALEAYHLSEAGVRLDAAALAARAEAGDAAARTTLEVYERRLARALAAIINIVDPDVIVMGGGVSNIERLSRTVPDLWADYVFSDRVDTRLVPARHGDSSGVRGAAWLWPPADLGGDGVESP